MSDVWGALSTGMNLVALYVTIRIVWLFFTDQSMRFCVNAVMSRVWFMTRKTRTSGRRR